MCTASRHVCLADCVSHSTACCAVLLHTMRQADVWGLMSKMRALGAPVWGYLSNNRSPSLEDCR
jgi:hypothetical protein